MGKRCFLQIALLHVLPTNFLSLQYPIFSNLTNKLIMMSIFCFKEIEAGLRVKVPELSWWHNLLCYFTNVGRDLPFYY